MTLQMLFARWLLVGLASLTVLSTSRVALSEPNNPLVRAAQSNPNIRGLKCVAWTGLARGSKEAYVLGVLSLADHLYEAATDPLVDEVNLDPETMVFFQRDAPFYTGVIDQLCRTSPGTTNVTTLLLSAK